MGLIPVPPLTHWTKTVLRKRCQPSVLPFPWWKEANTNKNTEMSYLPTKPMQKCWEKTQKRLTQLPKRTLVIYWSKVNGIKNHRFPSSDGFLFNIRWMHESKPKGLRGKFFSKSRTEGVDLSVIIPAKFTGIIHRTTTPFANGSCKGGKEHETHSFTIYSGLSVAVFLACPRRHASERRCASPHSKLE